MTIIVVLGSYFGFCVALGFFLSWSARRQMRPSRESFARVLELIELSKWHRNQLDDSDSIENFFHREQLEAQAAEMVELHKCNPDSSFAEQLEDVIWEGDDYDPIIRSQVPEELQ